MLLLTGILVLIMASVHIFAGKLRFINVIPRSRWLSAAGGAAVAYVFIHLLPELSRGQNVVSGTRGMVTLFREQHIYLTALLGLVVFYGLERAAKVSKSANRPGNEEITSSEIFTLHLVSFGIYNMLIGYLLLHREVPGLRSLFFFWMAMTLHFFSNDYELREDFKDAYKRVGRWVLVAAVILGWAIGGVWTIGRVMIAFLFAFVAGGVVLNVLRGELPAERKSSFWAFLTGVVLYTLLLLFE